MIISLHDSAHHLEMIFLFTEIIYTPFFPHQHHHHTTMSNLDKTFKLQAALLQLSRKMKDVNLLQDLQGLSNKTYSKILRLAEKHGKERKDKRPKKQMRRTFGFEDDEAISKVAKYNKWLKKKKSLAQRAVEEDWKGLVIKQAPKVSKNLQEEKWALKVALAHNYYMTCILWREIANFAMKKKIGLTTIINHH